MTSITSRHVAPGSIRADAAYGAGSAHRETFCAIALFATDLIAAMLTAGLVLGAIVPLWPWLRAGLGGPLGHEVVRRPELATLFIAIATYLGLKGRYRDRLPFWDETRLIANVSVCIMCGALVTGLVARDVAEMSPIIAIMLTFPVLATLLNRLMKLLLARTGLWSLGVLVIGEGENARAAETALASDISFGFRLCARLDPDAILAGPDPVRLRPLLGRYRADRLLVALDADDTVQRQIVECALREGVPFTLAPRPTAFPAFSCQVARPLGHETTLVTFRDQRAKPLARAVKAVLDVVVAAAILIVASPAFLLIAIGNKLDGGSVFYAHRRVGLEGRSFHCLKFRTMVTDGDRILEDALARDPNLAQEWRETRKLVNDPRVTAIGRILRQTSLDEIPQLINILRLEMSLVGPRPIVESEIPFYGKDIERYYAIKPGLTGLWQVSGRSTTTYERRVQLDVWYANNWSIWTDIAILLKTIPAIISRHGAV